MERFTNVVTPDALCAPADRIFRPVDPRAVPEIAAVLSRLEADDPDVIAAVADVDRSLIWAAMQMSPLDHVDACAAAIDSLTEFRDRARRPATGAR